jgi:hypothetical protein
VTADPNQNFSKDGGIPNDDKFFKKNNRAVKYAEI